MSAAAGLHFTLLDLRQPALAVAAHDVLQQATTQETLRLGIQGFAPLARTLADLQASRDFFVGAWCGHTLAGVLSVGTDDEPDQICITLLVVLPAMQRLGIGRALLQDALQRGGADTAFVVLTAQANAPALALYHGLGFVDYRYGQIGGDDGPALPVVKLRRAPQPAPSPEPDAT